MPINMVLVIIVTAIAVFLANTIFKLDREPSTYSALAACVIAFLASIPAIGVVFLGFSAFIGGIVAGIVQFFYMKDKERGDTALWSAVAVAIIVGIVVYGMPLVTAAVV